MFSSGTKVIKISRNFPITLIILALLFVGSYQSIVPTIADELLLILLFVFCIRIGKFGIKYIRIIFLYLFYGFILAIIKYQMDNNTLVMMLYEIDNDIKPLFVLFIFSSLIIDTQYRDYLLKWFIIINIPSIIFSIYQFNNRQYGYLIGLKMRNGQGRIQGLSGHPITLGFILISQIIIVLYFASNKTKRIHKLLLYSYCFLCAFLSYFTRSRYPIFVFFMIIISLYFFSRNGMRKYGYFIFTFSLLFIILIFSYPSLIGIIENEQNSVRMIGINAGLKSLLNYPFFGSGIGTFGTETSFQVNSYVYNLLDVSIYTTRTENLSSGNFFESGLFQKIIQVGIIGTIIYYYLFIDCIIQSLFYNEYLDFALISIIVTNSILNPLYRLPCIFLAGISVSHLNYLRKEKMDEKVYSYSSDTPLYIRNNKYEY